MTSLFARNTNANLRPGTDLIEDDETFAEVIRPIVAGARARGVADAFEMMGVAAVLIDGTGRVLHAGGRVTRLLGGSIRLVEGHMLGIDDASNAALQNLIAAAIGPKSHAASAVSIASGSGAALSIKAMRFPQADDGAAQLLRAILIVTEDQASA